MEMFTLPKLNLTCLRSTNFAKNTNMNYWLILIPLISAFIGWFTNWIAIKMLFHPKEPKKILGITFPKVYTHSANPIGSANIMGYINNFLMNEAQPQDCVRVLIEHTVEHVN